MLRRIRAAWAALTAPTTDEATPAPAPAAATVNGVRDLADEARAVQARDVRTVHMDTHHEGDTHHHGGGQVTNVAHGPVGLQARDINGATVAVGNSGIVNMGGQNSFTNTTVGGFHVGHNDGQVVQTNEVHGGIRFGR